MDSAQKQLTEKVTAANNILVTVSRNPSVDQLAACIGLTLILNKLNKHTTAVFSGEVPSTIEFLQPEGTLEKTTDSLRDFIIALDKSKADKLRYKVEDQLVRIFITPYRTSISQNDLEFSQGDFNVDLVIALGVAEQTDLDAAITAHGRILHDATVSSINATAAGALGSINWDDPGASSLCELVSELARTLGKDLLDPQISTALLTGVVAETARFSNEKTTPATMSVSSELLAAGADQQLVATKLQPPVEEKMASLSQETDDKTSDNDTSEPPVVPKPEDDGTLNIEHKQEEPPTPIPPAPGPDDTAENEQVDDEDELPQPSEPEADEIGEAPKIEPIMHQSGMMHESELSAPPEESESISESDELASGEGVNGLSSGGNFIVGPAPLSQPITTTNVLEPLASAISPLGSPALPPLFSQLPPAAPVTPVPAEQPIVPTASLPKVQDPLLTSFTPPPPTWTPPAPSTSTLITPDADDHPEPAELPQSIAVPSGPVSATAATAETLQKIEEAVHSPHLQTPNVDAARNEVMKALEDSPASLEPIQALNAQPLGSELHDHNTASLAVPAATLPGQEPAAFEQTLQQTIPSTPPVAEVTPQQPPLTPDVALPTTQLPQVESIGTPTAPPPPPVPPPIPYRFGNSIDQAQS